MNTITPLMHAIMEALDTADDGLISDELQRAVWASFNGLDDAEAIECAAEELAEHELVTEQLVEVPPNGVTARYHLTDAGSDALWALQKAGAISAQFIGIDTAHGPDQGVRVTFADGSVIECTDTNYAPLRQVARPVRFTTRDELRAYTSGAKP